MGRTMLIQVTVKLRSNTLSFLLGMLAIPYVLTRELDERCATNVHIFVREGDTILFEISRFPITSFGPVNRQIHLISKKLGCTHYISDRDRYCSEKRVSFAYENPELDLEFIDFNISITGAKISDNGSYNVSNFLGGSDLWPDTFLKCFTVFILGQPKSDIIALPNEIREGDIAIFQCFSTSTTVPDTHNLTIQTSWLVNGYTAETSGRFRVYQNELIIYFVTNLDKDLTISCEAAQTMGLITLTNTTVPVKWGPGPIPKLEPTRTFYHVDLGTQLPTITCSSDCHPPCDISWKKLDSYFVNSSTGSFCTDCDSRKNTDNHVTKSSNGTLWLGGIERNSSGEYVCTATRNGTKETGMVSVIVLVKEGSVPHALSQNYTPVIVVGGVLGTALLTGFCLVILLLMRGGCAVLFRSPTGMAHDATTEIDPEKESTPTIEVYND